jgi:hypothetical protein
VSNSGTELYAIDFDYDNPAYFIGNLTTSAQSGAFVGDNYYYIDASNKVRVVTFDSEMLAITSDIEVGSVDPTYTISDLAVASDTESIYILADTDELNSVVEFDIDNNVVSPPIGALGAGDYQLMVDGDGLLYGIIPSPSFSLHVYNAETGEFSDTNDQGGVDPPDGGGDITPGPKV